MKITDVNNYVVFDIETSGLNCKNDEIIQIKALKMYSGKNVGKFNALIKPQKALSVETERFLGISNKKLMKCHPIEEILPIFDEYVGNLPVVGYNLTFCNRFFDKYNEMLHNYYSTTSFDLHSLTGSIFPNVKSIISKTLSILYNEQGNSGVNLYYSCFEKAKNILSFLGDDSINITIEQLKEIGKEVEVSTIILQKKYNWSYSEARNVYDYLKLVNYLIG